ncbi:MULTISPECIES: amidohydrolase [Pseudoalteromonas]|uniref:amidohydrolase family protein n=1 Tax=Pseudoalteromonas TaxID=53246 RepID=UPI0006DCA1D2|nr:MULTISPECIES: amidohydrolase family protein [Pseudoalteromonas]KPW03662.1 Amidohydrolase [Pseudoalteromonas sp. P1-8]MDK9684832.1 amidohydrolase family protein [Pseudoalteromonas shioyasakiensis]
MSYMPNSTALTRIDCHQHFWDLSRGDYHWLTPKLEPIYRNFLPHDLEKVLSDQHVEKTILVQAADTEAETLFLLSLAESTEFVGGVVGWVDLEGDDVISRLKEMKKNEYFKGIRPMLQDIKDKEWILNEKFHGTFDFMAANNISFDALVKEQHLASINTLARQHPRLKIVINHAAKPNLTKTLSENWQAQLSQLAECDNVYVKLSGLMTETTPFNTQAADYQACFDVLLSLFGVQRIMWGSDWPVVQYQGDYQAWCMICTHLLAPLNDDDKQKIWADNARHFYCLSR